MAAATASPAPLEAGKMVSGMRIIESEEDAHATHPSKLDKEPLLESIYQEVTGGGSVKSLSPFRLIQASKTTLLCCLYMGIGTSMDRESLYILFFHVPKSGISDLCVMTGFSEFILPSIPSPLVTKCKTMAHPPSLAPFPRSRPTHLTHRQAPPSSS